MPGSLAAFLLDSGSRLSGYKQKKGFVPPSTGVPGVFNGSDSKRISILNGSHTTLADDHDQDTVLVFPDYTVRRIAWVMSVVAH